jgi:arylsulfatase A-like enzyme
MSLCILNAQSTQQPNIIFIYADDWGYGDLSCHGHSTITTPNLDQMAAGGTEFLQFNVSNPVCSPSRAAIMTGHYPSRYHIHQHFADHELNMDRDMPDWLDPDTHMLTRLFKQEGYKTAHYGKWHLTNSGVIDPPLPSVYGIDDSKVYNGPGPQLGVPIGISTGRCVDLTINFLEQNRENPVFVNLWIHESHAAIDPPQDAKDAYANMEEPFRSYYACISYADRELGRLFSYLEEEGLDSTTLVIFSSDNGPEFPSENPESKTWYSRGETAGLVGQKRSLHEGGIGLPFFVRWPGMVPSGIKNNTTHLAAVDILPSLCAIAGIDMPENFVPDGEDLSETFLGEKIQRTQPVFWEWRGHQGRENWPRLAVRYGDWKLLCTYDGSQKTLYNIQENRIESPDSLEYYPELADSLFRLVSEWKENLPVNIPHRSVHYLTTITGDQVVVDFSASKSILQDVIDPEFRLYRAENLKEIQVAGYSHDSNKIFLQLDSTELITTSEKILIAFRSGKIRDSEGRELLFFSTEPVKNKIQEGPDLFTLEFNLFDGGNMFRLENVTVRVDTLVDSTNLNGQVIFHREEGEYTWNASKENFASVDSSLILTGDTLIKLALNPTLADVKFRVLAGTTPVNQAEIKLDKTQYTNMVGISLFENLAIGNEYPYSVNKSGFQDVPGTLILRRDTTVEVALDPLTDISRTENDGIRLFPVPANQILIIKSNTPLSSVTILDLSGRTVLDKVVAGDRASISLEDMEEGSYLVRIKQKNGSLIIRAFNLVR